jgi:D-alanine-D-alanine ligase
VHFRRGAVLEPYREDLFDLEIAVRSWPKVELSAIARPIRQRAGAEILDYSDKYVSGEGMHASPRELPAELDGALAERIRELALRCAVLLQIRGIARVDFLSDGSELYLNEVNTVPGSLSRYLFIDPPRTFGELLGDLVDEAVRAPAAAFSSAGADGTVLRAASSIAAKLG